MAKKNERDRIVAMTKTGAPQLKAANDKQLQKNCYQCDNNFAYHWDAKTESWMAYVKLDNFVPTRDKWCLVCGSTCTKHCGKCKSVFFCDAKCQKQAWPIHEKHCGRDLFQRCCGCGKADAPLSCDVCPVRFCSDKCKKLLWPAHKDFDCKYLAKTFTKKVDNNHLPRASDDPFVFVWDPPTYDPPFSVTWDLVQKRLLDRKLVPEQKLLAFVQEFAPKVEHSYSCHYGSQKYIVAKFKGGPEHGVLVMVGYSKTQFFGTSASYACDEAKTAKKVELDLTAIAAKNWDKVFQQSPTQQLASILFFALSCDLKDVNITDMIRC